MEIKNQKAAEVARLFFEVSKIVRRGMRQSFETAGITMPQGLVLGALIKTGEMKITELSQKIGLSNSTISGIIDRLEKQQLVERARSEQDRRVVYVKVTPQVGKIHQGIHQKAEQKFADLLGTGTPEDIEKIIKGLDTLKKLMQDSIRTDL